MKALKRIVVGLLAVAMVLSFAACGSSEKTVVMRGDASDQFGLPTTDTWTLTAKGDTLQQMKEVAEIDLSEYDEDMRATMVSTFESLVVGAAEGIEGVTCTASVNDTIYVIELTVDCTGEAVQKAVDAGLLAVEGGTDRISLKQTQSSLESQGYEVVE